MKWPYIAWPFNTGFTVIHFNPLKIWWTKKLVDPEVHIELYHFILCSPTIHAVVEGAIKGYLAVALTEDAAKALTANLGMAEMFGHIQPNLGKVVLYWMGENADWELRELVEGLVFSRSLGRHTTALCTADQGM